MDRTRLQDLDEATRKFLAWESILGDKERLNLSLHQVKQAETQRAAADSAVTARIPEAYMWLLVPVQNDPRAELSWLPIRLSGQEPLAERASRKLRNDELLVVGFAATRLRMELDRVPLWRGDHVEIGQLVEDFARYHYLPRLVRPEVLLEAVRSGPSLLTRATDSFAYADSYDAEAGRYRGLHCGQIVPVAGYEVGLLVKPAVAIAQLEAERRAAIEAAAGAAAAAAGVHGGDVGPGSTGGGAPGMPHPPETPVPVVLKRFHGSVSLNPERVGRDASQVAEEVIAHLAGLVGARLKVTMYIEAEIPSGAPDDVVRTVTENSRTLRFTDHGFERERQTRVTGEGGAWRRLPLLTAGPTGI